MVLAADYTTHRLIACKDSWSRLTAEEMPRSQASHTPKQHLIEPVCYQATRICSLHVFMSCESLMERIALCLPADIFALRSSFVERRCAAAQICYFSVFVLFLYVEWWQVVHLILIHWRFARINNQIILVINDAL